MGEATCLMRSFSHPSNASREAKEGDPLRALTESISFGRFMSESLAWEKWSSFSHNRYLEEVEQFSKPGSVAQKKAYFEAHYKKRAAMKAAALLEQTNALVNDVPKVEPVYNNLPEVDIADNAQSPMSSALTEATNYAVTDKQQEDDGPDLAHSVNANLVYPDGETNKPQSALAGNVEMKIKENVEVNPAREDNSKQHNNAHSCDKTVAAAQEMSPDKDATEKEKTVLPSNKRQMNSSPKLSNQTRASKLPKPSTKQPSSTTLKGRTNANANGKKSLGDLIDRKRFTPKSVHMSINLAPRCGETSKGDCRMLKENLTTPKNPTRASVYGIAKLLPSLNQSSEDKRSRSLFNKSVSGRSAVGGILETLSGNNTKSSTKSKVRSSIISSPFRFRSEERAAKRKEFFQKLEEKNNAKEVEKTQMQVKSKVPLTRPRSPRLGRKHSSDVVHDTSCRIPQRSSVNAASSKHIVLKGNKSAAGSVLSLPKKKVHENASPNIQH